MRGRLGVLVVAVVVATLAACNAVELEGPTALTVAADGTVPVSVRCTGDKACSGTVRVRLRGVDSGFRSFSAPAGGTRRVVVTLTATQLSKLPASGGVAA